MFHFRLLHLLVPIHLTSAPSLLSSFLFVSPFSSCLSLPSPHLLPNSHTLTLLFIPTLFPLCNNSPLRTPRLILWSSYHFFSPTVRPLLPLISFLTLTLGFPSFPSLSSIPHNSLSWFSLHFPPSPRNRYATPTIGAAYITLVSVSFAPLPPTPRRGTER